MGIIFEMQMKTIRIVGKSLMLKDLVVFKQPCCDRQAELNSQTNNKDANKLKIDFMQFILF